MVGPQNKIETETAGIWKLPASWRLSELTDLTESESDIVAGPFGSNLKVSDYKNSGVPILRLQNIGPNTFIPKDIKFISAKKAKELDYHSFVSGDVILAKLGDPIGISCIVPKFLKFGIVVADVVRIRVSQRKADKNFIVQSLNSDYCLNQLNANKIGSTRPRVNLNTIRKIKFPIPPLFEQQKIAKILSDTDALIESLDKLITKKKHMKQGLMQTLLTKGIGHTKFKKTEIGEMPEGWEIQELSQICEKPQYGYTQSSMKVPVGPKFLRITDIQDMKVNWANVPYCICPEEVFNKYALNTGDILFARTGATTGKSYLVEQCPKAVFASYLIRLRPRKNVDPFFIHSFFNSFSYWGQIRRNSVGSAQGGVNAETLSRILAPLPLLSEQQEIAKILSDADKEIEALEQKRDKYKLLKTGMMQKLLTGGIRVK